jgi:hypothetical protein
MAASRWIGMDKGQLADRCGGLIGKEEIASSSFAYVTKKALGQCLLRSRANEMLVCSHYAYSILREKL